MPRATKGILGRLVSRPPSVAEERTSQRTPPTDPEDTDQSARSERRTVGRRGEECHGSVLLDGQKYNVLVTDLSEQGISCKPLPYSARTGAPVLVCIDDVQLVGRVAWRRQLSSSDDDVQVGVRFSSPHPDLIDEEH